MSLSTSFYSLTARLMPSVYVKSKSILASSLVWNEIALKYKYVGSVSSVYVFTVPYADRAMTSMIEQKPPKAVEKDELPL